MIFPHSIGSQELLSTLKAYNFLATVNSSNVPMDAVRPSDLLFAFRPVTLSFADYPSLMRYSANVRASSSFVAVNEFLDNPLLFYAHQNFFANGMDAFNAIADEVNRSEPKTQWRSLADIVRHLYLVRLRDDSDYDVLAFSSHFRLDNPFGRDVVFHIKKRETGSPAISAINLDGHPQALRLPDGYLELQVPVVAGSSRTVEIQYENDVNLRAVDIARKSRRVYILRMASDFRDLVLSQVGVGRVLTRLYYKYDLSPSLLLVWGILTLRMMCVRRRPARVRMQQPRVTSTVMDRHSAGDTSK
jgi:hypothetical protein